MMSVPFKSLTVLIAGAASAHDDGCVREHTHDPIRQPTSAGAV
jgi:hypothetical protein